MRVFLIHKKKRGQSRPDPTIYRNVKQVTNVSTGDIALTFDDGRNVTVPRNSFFFYAVFNDSEWLGDGRTTPGGSDHG